jgi:hypothetical protein
MDQVLEDREDESRGLSRTGLSQAQNITAFQDRRNGFELNRSRRCVAGIRYSRINSGMKCKRIKIHDMFSWV